MSESAVDEAAALIEATRRQGAKLAALPPECRPASEADGYAIQARRHAEPGRASRSGRAGYKIGCTTPVMQAMLGIPNPCYGTMAAGGLHEGTAALRHANFQRVGVECEIAVRLATDVPWGSVAYDQDAVGAAVESCMVAIEIVDDRYDDYHSLGVATLIADDFFHAGCIIGPPVADWRAIDLEAVRGSTIIDGRIAGTGRGADVMGHPFAAVTWLAKALAAHGQTLRAGDIVLTGSLVETRWVDRGAEVRVAVEALGEARVRLD